MRPQRNAAENEERVLCMLGYENASMRPQRNAAENMLLAILGILLVGVGFNEAAA